MNAKLQDDPTSASLMAQLEELNSLAGAVKTQTENAELHTRSNAGVLQPQTRSPGFESEAEREVIYGELKRLLDRREILRCLFVLRWCTCDSCMWNTCARGLAMLKSGPPCVCREKLKLLEQREALKKKLKELQLEKEIELYEEEREEYETRQYARRGERTRHRDSEVQSHIAQHRGPIASMHLHSVVTPILTGFGAQRRRRWLFFRSSSRV